MRHLLLKAMIGSGLIAASASLVSAEIISLELDDIASWADEGDAGNWVLSRVIDPGQQIVGFGYDLNLQTFGESWLSEAAIGISDAADLSDGFVLTPGAGLNLPGSADLTTGGTLPLHLIGSDPVPITSGTIRIEFYETFTDFPNQADSVWNGTLLLDVQPIPGVGAMALIGVAGVVGRGRRRLR